MGKKELIQDMDQSLMDYVVLSKLISRVHVKGACWEADQHQGGTDADP